MAKAEKTSIETEVVVIGAGPGGYTAAFRAADLGKKVVMIDRYPNLGGVCLNVGCIPSKALIHAATRFEEINAHANEEKLGIFVPQAPTLNMPQMIAWKDSIVARLSSGVESLLKKNKVKQVKGWAMFSDAKNFY